MREYNITLQVPDDFNPDRLTVNTQYEGDESAAPLCVSHEGFENIEEIVKEIVTMQDIKPVPGSVIIFKFPFANDYSSETLQQIHVSLAEAFPECTVLGMSDDIEVYKQNSAEAVKMLEGMIAKVKARSTILIP